MAKGSCDFLVEVAAELPLQAIAGLMGIPQDDRHELFGWADGHARLRRPSSSVSPRTPPRRRTRRCSTTAGDCSTASARQADVCRSTWRHRSPTVMHGDSTSELEQQMFFTLLVAAGTETTRNSIAVGLLALVDNSDQWRSLDEDRSLLPAAVEEILRWASSTTYNRRTAHVRHDCPRGTRSRAGDKVTLWWASANRDELVFKDPFRFDIRRDPEPAPGVRPRHRTSASAPTSLDSNSACCSRPCSTGWPRSRSSAPWSGPERTSTTGSVDLPVTLKAR